jgi:ferrous iron transport protein A
MAQFIRFGIHEGQRVRCIERLPGGTVVLQKNRQQIAIGHTLARQVFVVVIAGEA